MKKIKLTRDKYAVVDDEDYETLNKFKWNAHFTSNNWYARRNIVLDNKKRTTITMHSFLVETPKGMDIDHINGDGLDNRRSNLRLCTRSENLMNRPKNKRNKSGYKGVHWHKPNNKWLASIRIDKKVTYLGQFTSKIKAYKAYCEASKKHHKEFSNVL